MTKLIFTRYLYNKDEVELTLLESILKKKDFNEVYFWLNELYESQEKINTWQFIYKIYFDFYFLTNQKFYNKINSYYKKYQKKDKFNYLVNIVYNLWRSHKNITYDIFIFRTYYSNNLDSLITNIDLTPCKGNNRYEKLLYFSLKNNNNNFIAFYLKKIKNNEKIVEFVENHFNLKINLNSFYKNKFHIILSHILQLPKTSCKFIFKKAPKDAYNYVKKKINNKDEIHYKVLKAKRLYQISKDIGCFDLSRSDVILKNEFWYNWEFYAYRSIIWKKRFDKFKIKVEKGKKKIVFLDDDEMEEFYKIWGYEPDEQSKEVQDMSVCFIKSNKLKCWLSFLQTDKNLKIEKKLRY